jgi:GNAT superfamily N-acetyltransferase
VRLTPETPASGQIDGHSSAAPLGAEEVMAAELSLLLRVMQVMEDVWLACELDEWWGHPINLGWINLFARWATSPTFQFWWPLLSPMFSPGFRRFIQQRFPIRRDRSDLKSACAVPQKGRIEEVSQPRRSGLAAMWWEERSAQPARWDTPPQAPYRRTFYQYVLELHRGELAARIQVGLAAVTAHDKHAGWNSDDFFVPPSLWGAGLGGHFLRGLIERISDQASWCQVVVKAPPRGQQHQVARDDRQAFVEHYKKVGFREVRIGSTAAMIDRGLCDQLDYDEGQDTLLALDLQQWRERSAPSATSLSATPSGERR